MIKRKILCSLCLLILMIGCIDDSKEIDQRTMAVGLGIDKVDEDNYSVSIQAPVVTGVKDQAGFWDEFETFKETGTTP